MTEIFIVTEGRTEREVGKVLCQRGLLRGANPKSPNWRSPFGPREGYNQVIGALAQLTPEPGQRFFLIFDQEDAPSERERANQIARDLQNVNSHNWGRLAWAPLSSSYPNLFKAHHEGTCLVLHISNASGTRIHNRDFDGYILQLLQGPNAANIVQRIIPANMGLSPNDLMAKADNEFTQIMQRNGFPWQRNKAWLYAYITAFQFKNSHVWFASKVVEEAIKQNKKVVQQTFASLIYAWNWLVSNGGTCP